MIKQRSSQLAAEELIDDIYICKTENIKIKIKFKIKNTSEKTNGENKLLIKKS